MPRKNKKFKFHHFVLILLFLSLIFLFWNGNSFSQTPFFKKISQFNLWLAKPMFFLKNQAAFSWQNIKGYFQTKKTLSDSNQLLKKENLKLSAKAFKADILERENSELLNLLGKKPETDFLIAAILFRPPSSDFDTFIIDVGQKDGVQKGMKVTAYGDILLGEISETFAGASKVKLYSYYETQINIFFEKANFYAPAFGRGGENFEITLAKDIDIEIGEKILTADLRPFILGEVQKIIKSESAPFQKIYFRYPINLNELRYIYILNQNAK